MGYLSALIQSSDKLSCHSTAPETFGISPSFRTEHHARMICLKHGWHAITDVCKINSQYCQTIQDIPKNTVQRKVIKIHLHLYCNYCNPIFSSNYFQIWTVRFYRLNFNTSVFSWNWSEKIIHCSQHKPGRWGDSCCQDNNIVFIQQRV